MMHYLSRERRLAIDLFDELFESGTILSTPSGRLLVGWGKRTYLSSPESSQNATFYFPHFFLSDHKPWFQHNQWVETHPEALLKLLPEFSSSPPQMKWENHYFNQFQTSFDELQELFYSDKLLKAVPYVFETSSSKMTKERLIYSLKNLLQHAHQQPLYFYGFWEGGEGILGATPELLFRYKDNDQLKLETMACAGTRSEGTFAFDAKEYYEHQLVINGIKESLSPFGSVIQGNTEILKLSALSHLVTPISVNLQNKPEFDSVVKALHPTPALGAFPRHEGMKWLQKYQVMLDRRRYGAPVGYVHENGKDACCFVAIRNVQWNESGLAIGAGCGIVPDSLFENEWQEICLKIESIKQMLQL